MRSLLNLVRRAANLPMMVASVALFALMTLTFADVLMRSILNAPIEAATELIRIGIAIVVFAALPVVSARNSHIAVDLLDAPFRRLHLERARDGLIALGSGVMLWWPAGRVIDLAERARDYGDITEYLKIPTYYVAYFIAAMLYVTILALVVRGILLLIAPQLLGPQND